MDFHDRLSQFAIYKHGNLIYSKLVTLLLVIITCIGTRNKKKIEFDAQKMIFIPLVAGLVLLILSVLIYGWDMSVRLYAVRANIWVYMIASIFGTHEILLQGEVPQRLGEHHQSLPWHMGSRYAWIW